MDFKFCLLKDFFSPSKLLFLGRKLETKKKKKKKTYRDTSSYRKVYAFMACTLYFEETVYKTIFQLVKGNMASVFVFVI